MPTNNSLQVAVWAKLTTVGLKSPGPSGPGTHVWWHFRISNDLNTKHPAKPPCCILGWPERSQAARWHEQKWAAKGYSQENRNSNNSIRIHHHSPNCQLYNAKAGNLTVKLPDHIPWRLRWFFLLKSFIFRLRFSLLSLHFVTHTGPKMDRKPKPNDCGARRSQVQCSAKFGVVNLPKAVTLLD